MMGGIKEDEPTTLKIDYSNVIAEFWSPTVQIRFARRVGKSKEDWINVETVLQQLYISNLGNEKWEDVPTIEL